MQQPGLPSGNPAMAHEAQDEAQLLGADISWLFFGLSALLIVHTFLGVQPGYIVSTRTLSASILTLVY